MNSESPRGHDHGWLAAVPSFLRRRLSGRHLLQKAIGNTGWLIADKLIRLGLGLIVSVWLARYLGPGDFGLLNFAIAFVTLFSTLSNLGLQGVIVRDLVTSPQRRLTLLGSSLLLRLVGSAIAVILVAVVITLLRPGDPASVRVVIVVALMLLPQAWDVIDFDYQARIDARPIVIIRGVSFVVFSILKLFLIITGGTVIQFAWATTGEIVMSAALMSVYARARGTLPRLRDATLPELSHLLRTCWPLMATSLSVVLYWRIDQVMLGQMSGAAGVGVFSAAVRVSEVWYFIPVAVSGSAAPILTSIFQRSREEFLQKLGDVMHIMVSVGFAVAIALTVFARPLVVTLFGPRYVDAAPILAIHSWAGIFVAIGVLSYNWYINTGHLRYSMYQTFAGAVCNIALNSVLIPRYAGTGAAVATVASQIVSTTLLNAFAPESRELFRTQLLSCLPRVPRKAWQR